MRRVAIVNDDQTFIQLVGDLLRERGWEIIELHEGNAAFELVKREQPELVILDIRMEQPDTGWRVLNLLMLDPATRPIPIIMCSADWTELRSKEKWMAERGVGLLPRPFDIDDLFSCVDSAVSRDYPHLIRDENEA
jgi:CheY-like chemotaxis protein